MEDALLSRRDGLKVALLLGLGTSASAIKTSAHGRNLVAYFSRSGNTRVVAGQIQRAIGARLFEILPAEPYPEDYRQTVDQAKRETNAGYEPPLKQLATDISAYDTVFLGFPISGMTAPPMIHSFLTKNDLSAKALIPFITHGGYGVGKSLDVLAQMAPSALLHNAFVMKADQERETLDLVTRWLDRQPGRR